MRKVLDISGASEINRDWTFGSVLIFAEIARSLTSEYRERVKMSEKIGNTTNHALPILQLAQGPTESRRARQGRGRVRACVLILVHLLILAHIAHYAMVGRSVSPIEPSESMYTIELGHINAGAILFSLAVLSTAVFGRFFCGWGCHLIALQDLSSYLLRRIGFRPKPLRSRLLMLVPFFLAFYMFFWPTLKRLWRSQPHPGFSNHLITEDFWITFPGPIVAAITFVICGGLIVYLLGNKGFCTYACPYGAFFSVADRLAPGRIRVTEACQHCGQCTAHCTSNVQVHAEVRDFGMVVDPGCMKCLDCVSVCPNGALFFGFTSRSSNVTAAAMTESPDKIRRSRKTYDFSWWEEVCGLVVTGLTVFALRGLYDIPPLLLSVGLGVITAFGCILFIRTCRRRDQRLQNIQLKRNGRLLRAGSLLVALLGLWIAFILHSSVVQYFRYAGRNSLSRVYAQWDELLYGVVQSRLTEQDHANIDRAMRSFERSDRLSIADTLEIKRGLALAHMLKGDTQAAEKYLLEAYRCNPTLLREMVREFFAAQGKDAFEEGVK
jgi:ferredoxin